MTIEEVLTRHRDRLLKLPNVVDLALTERDGREAILVFVSRKLPSSALSAADLVPPSVEGFPTIVDLAPCVG